MMDNQRLMESGGFAFPASGAAEGGGTFTTFGMTLRDWYAGQALIGLVSQGEEIVKLSDRSSKNLSKICAVNAYLIADAMLKARSDG